MYSTTLINHFTLLLTNFIFTIVLATAAFFKELYVYGMITCSGTSLIYDVFLLLLGCNTAVGDDAYYGKAQDAASNASWLGERVLSTYA